MHRGYYKTWRCMILDEKYKRDHSLFYLWHHLLTKVAHETNSFFFENKEIIINRGQLFTGRKKLSEETCIKETTLERYLSLMECGQQIGQQKTTKYRIITIINFDKYQEVDNTLDNKRTTNGQQTDTLKCINIHLKNNTQESFFQNLWNDNMEPKITKITNKRRTLISSCWKDKPDEEYWKQVIDKVKQSDFLMGKKTDFRATFDFVFRKDKHIEIMEGKYSINKKEEMSVKELLLNYNKGTSNVG